MTVRVEALLHRAHKRAHRRFVAMLEERAYGDPDAPSTRLYVEAERRVDLLMARAGALPDGYSVTVTPQRKHKYRSLWNVRVWHGGERVFGRAYYSPEVGVREAHRAAWAMSRETA